MLAGSSTSQLAKRPRSPKTARSSNEFTCFVFIRVHSWPKIGKRRRRMLKPLLIFLLCAAAAPAAPKRVLCITHSAGYRHDSIPTSQQVLRDIGERTGAFEVVASEDLSLINAETLATFDVLYFFTSGELDLSDQQKADLLAFVRDGK